MGLGLYKLQGGLGAISKDFTYSNPVIWEVGTHGGILEGKFYLRVEDSLNQALTNGKIFAVDTSGADESFWYSFALDDGGPSTYVDVLDFEIPLGSEVPIWIRVQVPEALEIEPKDDVRIAATYIITTPAP